MNLPGTAGEPSCKRQENGDGIEPERPLKKARFAWEVKGKYHLKNETSDAKSKGVSAKAGTSSENESKLVGNTEQNLEILGDYLLKQDFNTLDSITDSNALLPSTSVSTEKLSYPRYVSSFESCRNPSESSSSNERPVPKSLVYSSKEAEDQCIARWQARQMAKCFVDNTINRVLDNWMMAPLPSDMDNNGVFALDAAEFINNLPGDNSIENEAILMAISAHGLQNNSSSCSNDTNNLSQSNFSSKNLSLSPPSSPLPSDDEAIQATNANDQNQVDESSNDFDMTWSSSDVKQNVSNNLPASFYPDTSNFSYQYCVDSESDNPNSSNTGYDVDENVNLNDNNHFDFLDAAVSFAIQYKGLTSYGTDYG